MRWIGLILLVVLSIGLVPAPPSIAQQALLTFEFGPIIHEDTRAAIRQAAEFSLTFIAETFGRPKRAPFTVHAYATLEELRARGYRAPAEFVGAAGPSDVWIDLSSQCFQTQTPGLGCNLNKVVIHEVFHTWQFEFVGPGYLPRWILEGMAEYAAYLGSVRMGVFTMEQGTAHLRGRLVQKGEIPSLSQIPPGPRIEAELYPIAALAFFRLTNDRPMTVTQFLEALVRGEGLDRSFQSAFGRTMEAFDAEFAEYARGILAEARPGSQPGRSDSATRIVGDGVVVPGTRVGAGRLGISIDTLIAEVGTPQEERVAPSGRRYFIWPFPDADYNYYGLGGARLEVWTAVNSRIIEEIRSHSRLFLTSSGITIGTSMDLVQREFPGGEVRPWGSGYEAVYLRSGLFFVYRLAGPRVVAAIGVVRPR